VPLSKAEVVGHDIGLMVAYAHAAQFPTEVTKLVLMDALLAGVEGWAAMYNHPDSFWPERLPEYPVSRPQSAGLQVVQGVMAMTRRGLPDPPMILSGAAMTMAPVGGSWSRLDRPANPNLPLPCIR
jgi:pimeloyl-ACP methyl ester carboxylesterase